MSYCGHPGLMPIEQALNAILTEVQPVTKIIEVALIHCLGKVVAQDIVSFVDVPPADNSAMDGYCLAIADLEKTVDGVLPVSQRIPAGAVPEPLTSGTAARIFTGAEIPEGADVVVMQENCSEHDGKVLLPPVLALRDNIRDQGQDILKGSVVVSKGQRLRPQELGLLASVGVGSVPVYKPLKVALLSTGDELIEPGEPARPSTIFNSNRYTLRGLLQALHFEIVDLGVVADTFEATEKALIKASNADCIISSGGVSVGEEDHVKVAIEKLGRLNLWKLAIKPGKPFAFGDVKGTPFLALPGNPVAAFATFLLLCRPYLLTKQGVGNITTPTFTLPANFSRKKAGMRQEYLRANAEVVDGKMMVNTYPNQSSGVLSSTCWGNGLVVAPIGQTIEHGQEVIFMSYSDLLY
ncbi:molybdopterin molybdenumtransferase MoeA [Gammaproteobacteria bacterium 42_54_T18]|nr:molybdopterin molybdenumtransferase MoeA [Gammaproteobacteria bacterium 42_54_T18]